MPDVIEAKASAQQFQPHPEGQYAMRCVDAIALGQRVEQFPGSPERVVGKCALVFQSGERNEEGRLHEVHAEMTISMNEKANLRRLLEQWRGKGYTEEQAQAGVPVHKLVGQSALIAIEHKTSGAGRVYAKISSIAPLPKAMADSAPTLPAYERPEFWQERKAQYAEEVAKYMARIGLTGNSLDTVPDALEDEDDDLPF